MMWLVSLFVDQSHGIADVLCGETAGWIELMLGTWLDLIQCLFVVDGVGKAV